MSRLLEVREYDLVTCNKDYMDDNDYKYLKKEAFEELEEMILSFDENLNADALDFFKIAVRRNVGKVIQAKNYVGLIQLRSGYQIQILPKIAKSDVAETKKAFLKMIRCLKDFPSKNFNEASLKDDRMNLYEIFISMFIDEVRHLLRKGIKSTYVPHEDNLNIFKGKLQVSEHIRYNMVHKERFYVRYDEFNVNRPENKLIKSTLLKLSKESNSANNMKDLRQQLSHFEAVEASNNYLKDFSRIIIDRNTKDYELLLQWARVFLQNKSFTTFSGTNRAKAILFPMEKVFESYVAKHLKRALIDLEWEVSSQDRGKYLFDEPQRFALRPDIVISREDECSIILDTKWKNLVDNANSNYGISQADMYQMYAYAKKYKTPEIWLLYPQNDILDEYDNISFISYDDEEIDVSVNVFLVDINNIEISMKKLKNILVGRNSRLKIN